jgi:hypothetical protein
MHDNGAIATWRGLTDGKVVYPDDELVLQADVCPTGAIAIQVRGHSRDPGAFGAVVPFTGISIKSRIYVPSFGGTCYTSTNLAESLTLSGGAPYLEATALAIEGETSSLGIWSEDRGFKTSAILLVRTKEALAVAVEYIAPLPCDSTTDVATPKVMIDAVRGDWKAALAPYRDWYVQAFASEIAQRNQVTWASRISTAIDQFDMADRNLGAISKLVDPQRTLLHVWEARAPAFDQQLPDWSPRAGYGEFVARAKQRGFRTMAYVNTYCVNTESPKVVANKIPSFALTRKWFGIHQWGDPPVEWATAVPGQLLYLDPLAPGWRDFHVREMQEWARVTRTDANYEDVASIAGDSGNGTVVGMMGAEGGTAIFQALLARNGSVPMATEHVADHMAFASRWPMRLPQRWGDDAQRRFWMSNLRPVCTYIFGHGSRPWIPLIGAESEKSRVLIMACSDALGGLAQFPAHPMELDARHGILAHMIRRARLWESRSIQPDLRPATSPSGPTCRYQDAEGRGYTYSATDSVHEFRDDAGHPLYQRITAVTKFDSPLRISGWPAFDNHGPIGLSPNQWYALEPDDGHRTAIEITAIPQEAMVSSWAETTSFATLELAALSESSSKTATVSLIAHREVAAMTLNDLPCELAGGTSKSYRVNLPARMVFAFNEVPVPANGPLPGSPVGRFRSIATGIDRGAEYVPRARTIVNVDGFRDPVLLVSNEGGGDSEVARDYLFRVPSADSSAMVVVRTTQRRFGNGAIVRACVNGREVQRVDFPSGGGTPPTDGKVSDAEQWIIPLGTHVGQMVLLTLYTDGKADDNSDQIWVSLPTLIDDSGQVIVRRPANVDSVD